jgi:hypothetical protein
LKKDLAGDGGSTDTRQRLKFACGGGWKGTTNGPNAQHVLVLPPGKAIDQRSAVGRQPLVGERSMRHARNGWSGGVLCRGVLVRARCHVCH